MCAQITSKGVSSLIGYTYPVLHKGVRWYVDFFAMDPYRNEMRRKRYYINGELKKSEKIRRAAEIIEALTKQLMTGWNPFIAVNEERGYILFEEVIEKYLLAVEKKDRKKTRDSYRSRVNIMKEYIAQCTLPIKYAYQFDEAFCNEFIDWIFLDRESSPRTTNNYRGWLYGFAEWMIARKYIKENPVEHVQQKAEHEKYRKDLSEDMLKKMSEHLLATDKYFYLACMMQYYTLIRPGELSNLKVGDISVSKQTAFVSKEFSKNHKDAEVGVNDNIIKLMIDLGVLSKPSNYYLFSKKFMPGEEHVGADQFNKRWKKMRTALGWADCYQFYSLKDTGIRDLANSEGVVVARDQARHSDISTTNKYIQKHGVQESTLHFDGGLSLGKDKKKKVVKEEMEDEE